ncbi:MAG: hypothetical protein AB7U29_02650 [Desulfobulbus sp.]
MYRENRESSVSVVEILKLIISCLATCIGLIVIVIGLKYAMDVFQLVFTLLHSPFSLAEPIQQLAASFGGNAFDINLSDRTVPLAKIIALVVYCFGVFTCAFLTMALMQTGAKIVSLTTGDRSAVKQLLQSAFGRRLQPKEERDKLDRERD